MTLTDYCKLCCQDSCSACFRFHLSMKIQLRLATVLAILTVAQAHLGRTRYLSPQCKGEKSFRCEWSISTYQKLSLLHFSGRLSLQSFASELSELPWVPEALDRCAHVGAAVWLSTQHTKQGMWWFYLFGSSMCLIFTLVLCLNLHCTKFILLF